MLWAVLMLLSFSISAFAAVNINTATQAELESLKGIGPVKAKAIIDYRKKNGDFKSVDDLDKVDGIGAVTLQNLRKDVSTSGKTTVVAPEAKAADKKSAKDTTKTVGNEKAAASGKTADTKEVKPTTDTKAKAEVKADTKAKADSKADATTDKKSKKSSKDKTTADKKE